MRSRKRERQARLQALLAAEPLLTDQELARRCGVSVQTIRLDRLELGLPEMRERARQLAEKASQGLRSLLAHEVWGELVELELGRRAVSVLTATKEMGFARTGIVRGHYLFAQANSLAVAVIDAQVALTGAARLRFHRPVKVGQRVIARAEVRAIRMGRFLVHVVSQVQEEDVFTGQFVVMVPASAPLAVGGGVPRAEEGLV